VKHDAIVIGGGPAGATAALMLARAGWSVAIVEKKNFPRRKVCGEFISATSLPLLHEVGVLDNFLQQAGPDIRRVGLFSQDLMSTASMPQPPNSFSRWGKALGREHLDMLLIEAARRAGARLWQPWSASELMRCSDAYVCTITAPGKSTELCAPIVIAAHGSWENGPLPTQVWGQHKSSDLVAFKAHFLDCDLPEDLMPLLAFPGGYGGMVHSDGGRVSLSCCIRRDKLQACRQFYGQQRAAEAVLEHIKLSCIGVRRALTDAVLDSAWLSAGPIQPGIRKCMSNGIFLTGNCAGEAHPVVAEGISMAMQSTGLLCRRLIINQDNVMKGRCLEETGKSYAAAWESAFAPRIRAAALFAKLAASPTAANLLRPVMRKFPKILSIGAGLSGKSNQFSDTPLRWPH
jgi:flavin-dependent dehydrogenase